MPSALLSLHEALLLVARGLDLRVGGVVGVIAESHCWPVVRSPLGGGSMTQSQWACPHPPGTPPPTCPSPTRDSAEHRDSLLKGARGLL